MVQVHIDYVLVRLFSEGIDEFHGDADVKRVLVTLCTLYAVHGIVEDAAADLLRVTTANSFMLCR